MNLRQGDRETIVDRVIRHRYGKELAEVTAATKKLGDKVYDAVYPKAVRDLMAKLPPGAFLETTMLRFDSVHRSAVEMSTSQRVFYSHAHGNRISPGSTAALDTYFAQKQVLKKLEEKIKDDRRELKATLEGFRTTNQLRKHWPEIDSFIPNDPVQHPLTRIPQNLNARFKLPPKSK